MIVFTIITLLLLGIIILISALDFAEKKQSAESVVLGLLGLYLFVLGVIWIVKM